MSDENKMEGTSEVKEEDLVVKAGPGPGPGTPTGPAVNNDDPNDQMFSIRNIKNYIAAFSTALGTGSTNMVTSYFMFFFTEFMSMSSVVVSIIMSIGTVVDGVSDFLCGLVLDRFHTKSGKAKHWVLWMGIPTGVSMALIFTCPENAPLWLKIVYLVIIYNVFNTCLTFVRLPSKAMMVLSTDNQQARSTFWWTASMAETFGGMLFSGLMVFFASFFGGLNKMGISGYRGTAWCLCVFCGITLTISGILFDEKHKGHEIDEEQLANERATGKKQISSAKMIIYLLKNKYWIIYQLYNIMNSISMGFMMGVGTYFAKYILGDLSKMMILMGMSTVPGLLGAFALAPFLKKVDARILSFIGATGGAIAALVMWISGGTVWNILVVTFCAKAFCNSFTQGAFGSLMGRVIDYGEWKFGTRLDGLSFAGQSVLQKIMQAVSTILVGAALALTGYKAGGNLSSGAISAISFMYLAIPFFALAIGAVLILFFNLPQKKVDQMRAEINARKAAKEM